MAKLNVGDPAPDFELPGTGAKTYRLSDYRGRKLILAFYPGDFTAVCTKQFCSYRDQGEKLDGLGADAGLPPEYALVGKVDKGLAVVERIGKLGTASEKPKQTVLIEKMTIEKG